MAAQPPVSVQAAAAQVAEPQDSPSAVASEAPARVEPALVAPVGAAEPVVTQAPAAPVAASAPAATRSGLPRVQAFELPVQDLNAIAESAQLEWVNSNAERVAQVRAAIAAEPAPVHVPRQRPPLIVIDEGALELVETRQDLGRMELPNVRSDEAPAARV